MKKALNYALGSLCGFLNGLFGSGGGVAAVPCLEKSGAEPKKAHATSVALIFVLSIATSVMYFINGKLDFALAFDYIPYGLAGAVLGSLLLKKIPNDILRRIFGAVIIIGALRILFSL